MIGRYTVVLALAISLSRPGVGDQPAFSDVRLLVGDVTCRPAYKVDTKQTDIHDGFSTVDNRVTEIKKNIYISGRGRAEGSMN